MNNSTLCPVDVVGITVSSRVKPKMCLWFVVTHVHLLSRSCNDCFSEAHRALTNFSKDWTNKWQHLLKKCMLKKREALQEQVYSGLKMTKCPFAHTALQKWGLDFPSAAEELFIKHLQPRTWVLYNWNGSPDLSVSFWANNRVASFNFSLKQFYLGPFLLG